MTILKKMQRTVDAFNEICPVGQSVIVEKDDGKKIRTTVKYPAKVLSGHTPVVFLHGISGCYALNRVIVDNDVINSRETINKAYGITRRSSRPLKVGNKKGKEIESN